MTARTGTGVLIAATLLGAAWGSAADASLSADPVAQLRTLALATATASPAPDPRAVALGAEVSEQAPELLTPSGLRDAAIMPRRNAWDEMLLTLDTEGRRSTIRQAHRSYEALRRSFAGAQSSNNVRAMCVAVFEAELRYEQLVALMGGKEADRGLPLTPPRDLRASYESALQAVRKDWMVALQTDRAQVAALTTMFRALSLKPHLALLERARTNSRSSVSLEWLARVYQDLTLQDPMNIGFWFGRASSQRLLGNSRAENAAWHEALDLFPESAYGHWRLAVSCGASQREATRAVAHLRWLEQHVADELWQIRVQIELARRFLQVDGNKEAQQHAAEATKLTSRAQSPATVPLYVDARRLESRVLIRQGRADDAISALADACEVAPRDIQLKLDTAAILFMLALVGPSVNVNRAEAAMRWYDKALNDQPRCAAAHACKAYLHLAMGRLDRAQEEAVLELTVDPGSVCALSLLGFAYLANNDPANALVFFGKALDFDGACRPAQDGRERARSLLPDTAPGSTPRDVDEDEQEKANQGQDDHADQQDGRDKRLPD